MHLEGLTSVPGFGIADFRLPSWYWRPAHQPESSCGACGAIDCPWAHVVAWHYCCCCPMPTLVILVESPRTIVPYQVLIQGSQDEKSRAKRRVSLILIVKVPEPVCGSVSVNLCTSLRRVPRRASGSHKPGLTMATSWHPYRRVRLVAGVGAFTCQKVAARLRAQPKRRSLPLQIVLAKYRYVDRYARRSTRRPMNGSLQVQRACSNLPGARPVIASPALEHMLSRSSSSAAIDRTRW